MWSSEVGGGGRRDGREGEERGERGGREGEERGGRGGGESGMRVT